MSALWRGSRATQARIASGLILYVYVLLHFLNIGAGLISPAAADAFQDARQALTRTLAGSVLLYGALGVHAVLALAKLAKLSSLRMRWIDAAQIAMGLTIPVLLATHIVFTRGAHGMFATNDTLGYLSGLIWGTRSGWWQAFLLLITWAHGSIGLHIWLRMWRGWRRCLAAFAGFSVFVPVFALAGFVTEGRRAAALLAGVGAASLDFMDLVNWPGPAEFAALVALSDNALLAVWAVLVALGLAIAARLGWRRWQKRLRITYVGGPVIQTAPGPTLLEMSRAARVPHTALCGGRGRCTTCRVVVEDGADTLEPPSPSELKALRAVGAADGTRLACQMRPTAPLTVYRVFRGEAQRNRAHASQGKEAQLAILFLDMRSFTARTTGQLPYDVVFLLNRFFDAIVPAIRAAGGTVDKYLGDGLLAVFEMPDPRASARAGLKAAEGIGAALRSFNAQLIVENEAPVKIGLSLHLGTVVLGEIGAAGSAPRTLIGDAVNTASRLEGQTKALGVEALISVPVLEAADIDTGGLDLERFELRGVANPLAALPVKDLADLGWLWRVSA